MAHKLLSKYPTLDGRFLFLNVYAVIPKLLYPLLAEAPDGASQDGTAPEWIFYNNFKKDYLNASDADFLFTHKGVPCDEEAADKLLFRTSLKSRDGEFIVIEAHLNTVPKSRWFAKAFHAGFPQLQTSPVQEETAFVPNEDVVLAQEAAQEDLPLTQRYSTFSKLIFLDTRKIAERLVPLTADPALTVPKVNALFERVYREQGLEACRFTLNNKPSSPEEADTLYFTTTLSDVSGKPLFLQCERNQNAWGEPWFGKFFSTDDWRADLSDYALLRRVRIFDSHIEYGLRNLACDISYAASPKDCSSKIAQRFDTLSPDEILYFKGTLRVSSEEDADQMIFPSGYHTAGGEEIMLRCKLNRKQDSHRWVSRRFFLRSQNSFYGRKPGKWLFSWAKFDKVNSWNLSKILPQLKNMAIPEAWSLGGEDEFSILRNYLIYTFARLWRENKVVESNELAAFNTGLVNHTYDYIYALFCRSDTAKLDGLQWQFLGFCLANENNYGKMLARNFYPLPQPARYFCDNEPIYYSFNDSLDAKAQIPGYDTEHVLLERVSRLPIAFLRKYTSEAGIPELKDKLDALSDPAAAENHKRLWSDVRAMLQNNPNIYRDMNNDFSKALEMAVRRAAWNYRTAIPYYDPTDDKICLLLPISLASLDNSPDVAMVLEPHKQGGMIHYMGHTIITLSMAYSNSRLVCRPESDWLNVETAQSVSGGSLDLLDEDD